MHNVGVTAHLAGRAARWSATRTGQLSDSPLGRESQLRAIQNEAERAAAARKWREVALETKKYL